jgi:hypothetical protein
MCSSMKFNIKCFYDSLVSSMLSLSITHLNFELFTLTVWSNSHIFWHSRLYSLNVVIRLSYQTYILFALCSNTGNACPPLRTMSRLPYVIRRTSKEAALCSLSLFPFEYCDRPNLIASSRDQFQFSRRYKLTEAQTFLICLQEMSGRLCGVVVRVPGHRFRGPGSIPGATRFSEK